MTALISGIKTTPVVVPFKRPPVTASGAVNELPLVLLDLETDAGLIGRAYLFVFLKSMLKPTMGCVTAIEELVKGMSADPEQVDPLLRRRLRLLDVHGILGQVLSGLDMALWDIKGKALNKPVYELLGGKEQEFVIPYASLQPVGHSFEEYRDSLVAWAEKAKSLGFKAVKSEVTLNGPYAHSGLNENDDKTTEVVAAVRKALGPDIHLMIDVQYRWKDAEEALRTVKDWAEFNIYFLETPVWTDDIKSYARMHDEAPMKIAAGEWLSTRYEFEDLIINGKIDVAQPDVGRCGGLTEAKKIAKFSQDNNRIIVPHCWKTSVSISATANFAFNTSNCAFIEYLPPQMCVEILRKELATEGFDFVDGKIIPPTKPGLGIQLNKEAIKKYQVA